VAYLCETRRNIPHRSQKNPYDLNKLDRFGVWTENPRVGGSIPPLATIKFFIFQRVAVGLCRGVLLHMRTTVPIRSLKHLGLLSSAAESREIRRL
jgi:hypothetical protein